MRVKFTGKYLKLPIKSGAEKTLVRYIDAGAIEREYLAELSSEPEYYIYEDVSELAGRTLELFTSPAFSFTPEFADELPAVIYGDDRRPKLYFTPRQGWMNDPNGLHYFNGKWNMFFQHNPYGSGWDNMSWGHAVSDDLLHWTERADALRPDAIGAMFSGSGVVTKDGRSALIYTADGGESRRVSEVSRTSQCVAFSDDGVTYKKYCGNPVLPHIVGANRDPKVSYFEKTGKWVMPLYLDEDIYGIYTSDNLTDWSEASRLKLAGCSECPDLFPLVWDGAEKWIFWAADGHYYIGEFDGERFTPTSPLLRHLWRGGNGDPYASQTFNNSPDGRRIQLHWIQRRFNKTAFNSLMSLPHELTLGKYSDGSPRLHAKYIKELDSLALPEGVERVTADLAEGDAVVGGVTFHYNKEKGAVEFAGRSERASFTTIDAVSDRGYVGALLDGGFAYAGVGTLSAGGVGTDE